MGSVEAERAAAIVSEIVNIAGTQTAERPDRDGDTHSFDSNVVKQLNAEPFDADESLERLVADAFRD